MILYGMDFSMVFTMLYIFLDGMPEKCQGEGWIDFWMPEMNVVKFEGFLVNVY